MVLNLWVLTPLGVGGVVSSHAFTGVAYQMSNMTDIYVMIPNSSKIAVMKQQVNNFMVRSCHTREAVLKGGSDRKVVCHLLLLVIVFPLILQKPARFVCNEAVEFRGCVKSK